MLAAVASVAFILVVGALALSGTRLSGCELPFVPRVGESFPAIDRSGLSSTQQRVMDVLHEQFEAQPPGTKFSENVAEPWCADFVSWVMQQAGVPLSNPNSGSWRIPGVYTMQEYFVGAGRLIPAGTRPQAADVMLWGPESSMGLHASIVITADATSITTVGGNEGGIHVRHNPIDEKGLLGFGRLA